MAMMTPIEIRQAIDSLGIEVRESGFELKLQHCPYCEAQGTHAPYQHFSVNGDTGAFNCLRGSCGSRGNLYRLMHDMGHGDLFVKAGRKPKRRPAENPKLVEGLDSFYAWYHKDRGIEPAILQRYGVGRIERDGKVVFVYQYRDERGILLTRKYRFADKSAMWTEKDCEMGYYGAHLLDYTKPRLHVVEGEDDCHAAVQLGVENVVSAPGATTYTPAMDKINERFREIVLLYDNDPAGQQGARSFAMKAGMAKCRNVMLPYKDTRECLLNGIDVFAIHAEINKASQFKDDEIIKASGARKALEEYLSNADRSSGRMTKMREFDKILRGLRVGELTVVIGHTGSGKSTFAYNMANWADRAGFHCLLLPFENRLPAVIRKLIEVRSEKSVYVFDNVLGRNMLAQPQEWISQQIADLDARPMWFLNKQGFAGRGYYDLDRVIDLIEYAVKFYGVNFIVCDHLHYFLRISQERNPVLAIDEAVRRLKILTEQHSLHMVLVVHPSKIEDSRTGKLARLGLNSSKGASSIAQEADNYIIVSKKAEKDGPLRSKIEILKNREFGTTGEVYFNVLPNRNTFVDTDQKKAAANQTESEPKVVVSDEPPDGAVIDEQTEFGF